MQLTDLQPNTAITLEVDVGNKIYPMESTVIRPDMDGILLMPIFNRGQMLDFNNGIFKDANITLLVTAEHGSSRMQWKNVSIETVKKKAGYYYRAKVSAFNSMAKNVNRRGNNRFPVIGHCTCTIMANGAVFPATMADISVSGIAFTLPIELPLVRVNLNVDFDDVAGGSPFHIRVNCNCIRIMPKEGAFLYGCQMTTSSTELLIYLTNKQEDQTKEIVQEETDKIQMTDEEALRAASEQHM